MDLDIQESATYHMFFDKRKDFYSQLLKILVDHNSSINYSIVNPCKYRIKVRNDIADYVINYIGIDKILKIDVYLVEPNYKYICTVATMEPYLQSLYLEQKEFNKAINHPVNYENALKYIYNSSPDPQLWRLDDISD